MRILLILIIIFITKYSYSYDFVDQRNSPLIVAMKDNEWNLVTDKNYIPFLQFKNFYDNLNEPQLSIYIDTKVKKYRELYTYLSNQLLIETQVDVYRDGKNLSTEDKKLSYTKFLNSILTLNSNKLQKVTDLSKNNIGFTDQNKIIDHFHIGKFIELHNDNTGDKYCSIFYFWSEKINADTYKIRIQSIICNLDVKSGSNPFIQDKVIEDFVKNIHFYNEEKFKNLYIDEITRLKKIKEEKELEKKRIEEEKRIAEEKAKELQRKKEEEEKKLKENKLNIQLKIKKTLKEIQLTYKEINSAISEIKTINKNFDPSNLIKKLNNYLDFYTDRANGILNSLQNINESISKFDGDKNNITHTYKELEKSFEEINILIKKYKNNYNEYLSNITKREQWVIKDRKQKAEVEKKKREEELKKQKELERLAALKKKVISDFQSLIMKKEDLLFNAKLINDELNTKLDINRSENFIEEILLTQEKERANLENTFNVLKKSDEDLMKEIKKLNSIYSYTELADFNNNLLNINTSITDISRAFNNNNLILKNLILSNIEIKQQEKENQKFIYILLTAIIVLIIILIIVFIYFIRSGRKNKAENNNQTTMKEKNTSSKIPSSSSNDSIKNNNSATEKKNNVEVEKKESKVKEDKIVTQLDIDTDKVENIKEEITNNDKFRSTIIKEYLDAFKNPKSLQEFILKWKINALDRVTSMSSKEEIVLETSKKIIDLSNFWSIRDPDNDLILYVLPGKVLWSRIGEILSDNSRFGYMNFNGVYELKEAKESLISEIAIGQKDESGNITIIEKGSANIFRVI